MIWNPLNILNPLRLPHFAGPTGSQHPWVSPGFRTLAAKAQGPRHPGTQGPPQRGPQLQSQGLSADGASTRLFCQAQALQIAVHQAFVDVLTSGGPAWLRIFQYIYICMHIYIKTQIICICLHIHTCTHTYIYIYILHIYIYTYIYIHITWIGLLEKSDLGPTKAKQCRPMDLQPMPSITPNTV